MNQMLHLKNETFGVSRDEQSQSQSTAQMDVTLHTNENSAANSTPPYVARKPNHLALLAQTCLAYSREFDAIIALSTQWAQPNKTSKTTAVAAAAAECHSSSADHAPASTLSSGRCMSDVSPLANTTAKTADKKKKQLLKKLNREKQKKKKKRSNKSKAKKEQQRKLPILQHHHHQFKQQERNQPQLQSHRDAPALAWGSADDGSKDNSATTPTPLNSQTRSSLDSKYTQASNPPFQVETGNSNLIYRPTPGPEFATTLSSEKTTNAFDASDSSPISSISIGANGNSAFVSRQKHHMTSSFGNASQAKQRPKPYELPFSGNINKKIRNDNSDSQATASTTSLQLLYNVAQSIFSPKVVGEEVSANKNSNTVARDTLVNNSAQDSIVEVDRLQTTANTSSAFVHRCSWLLRDNTRCTVSFESSEKLNDHIKEHATSELVSGLHFYYRAKTILSQEQHQQQHTSAVAAVNSLGAQTLSQTVQLRHLQSTPSIPSMQPPHSISQPQSMFAILAAAGGNPEPVQQKERLALYSKCN